MLCSCALCTGMPVKGASRKCQALHCVAPLCGRGLLAVCGASLVRNFSVGQGDDTPRCAGGRACSDWRDSATASSGIGGPSALHMGGPPQRGFDPASIPGRLASLGSHGLLTSLQLAFLPWRQSLSTWKSMERWNALRPEINSQYFTLTG